MDPNKRVRLPFSRCACLPLSSIPFSPIRPLVPFRGPFPSASYPLHPRNPRFNLTFMSFFKHRFFLLALRIALGGVFIYAGATKISNPQAFADSIATFQLLPNQLTNIVALALPPFEVLLGVILIIGWKTRASSIAAAGLSLVFVIALGQAIARGIVVDCGCFGSGEPSLAKTWMSFGRACLLLAASSWLYFRATLRL